MLAKDPEKLNDFIKLLPKKAGVYRYYDKNGKLLYVGKAKNLKSRVCSYFNKSSKSPKTLILIGRICEFDFVLTTSEAESLVLENNLIKEHRPKYNIRLKDDKSYPYIKIDRNKNFPKLEYIRRPQRAKKIELLGPYPVGSNISNIFLILGLL